MMFYYFAYGSNMLTTRLTQRCPGAIVAGPATAADTVVEFSNPSEDKSGKATLRQAVGNRTAGVVFTIPRAERDQLDSCEWVGKGYERCDAFPVRLVDGNEIIQTAAYLATSSDSSLNPL